MEYRAQIQIDLVSTAPAKLLIYRKGKAQYQPCLPADPEYNDTLVIEQQFDTAELASLNLLTAYQVISKGVLYVNLHFGTLFPDSWKRLLETSTVTTPGMIDYHTQTQYKPRG